MAAHHFLLLTLPLQGHINPALQLAKQLLQTGAKVTYASSMSVDSLVATNSIPEGVTLAAFPGGYDRTLKTFDEFKQYKAEVEHHGFQNIAHLVSANAQDGQPITCIIYSPPLPLVSRWARELHLRSALLWPMSAAALSLCYFCFNGLEIRHGFVELPGLPAFASSELPAFLDPSSVEVVFRPSNEEQFEALKEEIKAPKVLINTFDAFESAALKAVDGKFNLFPVGGLISSNSLDGKDELYMKWLNSKPKSSVLYISFGTVHVLRKQQIDEIVCALINSKRPFLWATRDAKEGNEENDLERNGMIVPWCSQVEVLSHPSIGCFATHCGWNSTLESLVFGVPVVAFPQGMDQMMNAKLIEDVWKTGMRVKANEKGIFESSEIISCLETILGNTKRGKEIKENVKKLRGLAKEAKEEGGSTGRNLASFLNAMAQN